MKKYTREQLIHYMRKLSKELKHTPTAVEMNAVKKYPSSSTYRNRFGSWNSSLRIAELPVNVRTRYTKKELVESLKQLRKELGRRPVTSDLKDRPWLASPSTYRKYFGSWKDSLKKAGINPKDYKGLKGFV